MKERWKHYQKELAVVLIVAMVVSLLSHLPNKASAKVTGPVATGNGIMHSLSASLKRLSFGYGGGSTLTSKLSGVTKNSNLYGIRKNSDTWYTFSIGSDNVVSVTSTRNYNTYSRTGYLEITDRGNGSSVTITIVQDAAPPTPTPRPTNTPTPRPTKTPTPRPTKTPTPRPTNTPTPKMTADTTSLSFGYNESNSRVVTLTNARGTLRADRVTNADWITASPSGSKVTFTVNKNGNSNPRTGTVDITDTGSGQTIRITVSQKGAPTPTPRPTNTPTPRPTNTPTPKPTNTPTPKPPTKTPTPRPTNTPTPKMTADTTSLSFGYSETNSKTVTITNARGTLRADRVTNADWITASPSGSKVTFTVTKNGNSNPRTGTVDITDTGSGQTIRITVSQKGAPTPTPRPTNTPTPKPTNTPTPKPPTKTPTPRPTNTPTPKLAADTTSLSFGYNETNSKTVTITNAKGTLRADRVSNADWITASPSGSKVTFTVTKNGNSNPRTGTVDITDTGSGRTIRITVSQKGAPTPTPRPTSTKAPTNTPTPKLTADTTNLSFGYNETNSKTVTITNAKGTLRADRVTNADWITASPSGSKVTFTVTKNGNSNPRTGTVDITDTGSGRTIRITVSQKGAPTPTPRPTSTNTPTKSPNAITASATTLTLAAEGDTKSVSITNNRGTLRADKVFNADWISVKVSGSTVSFTANKNGNSNPRTGTVDITDTGSGQTIRITVTQKGTPTPTPKAPTPTAVPSPELAASTTTLTLEAAGDTKTVTITNKQGTLRADKVFNADWITVSISGSTVTFTANKNGNSNPRTGSVDITDMGSGQTVRIVVSQKGTPTPTPKTPTPTPKPSNTITPTKALLANPYALTFTSGKSSKTITLSNVKATSNIRVDKNQNAVGWVNVTGSGSNYTVSVDANTSGEHRKGVITFTDTSDGRYVNVTIYQSNVMFCRITFDSNGGSPIYAQAQSVVQGASMEGIFPLAPNPPQSKFFVGWYDQKQGGKEYTDSSFAPYQEELVLYAHWDSIKDTTPKALTASQSKLTFDYRQGSEEVEIGGYKQPVSLYAIARQDSSWVSVGLTPGKSATYTIKVEANNNIEKRTGYVDVYDQNSGSHIAIEIVQSGNTVDVSFDENGGYAYQIGVRTYQIGKYYNKLPIGPTAPKGKEFVGWFTERTGGRQITAMSIVEEKITTLYAQYVNNVKVTVKYSIGDGTPKEYYANAKKTVIVGEKYGTLESGPKHPAGLRFVCWKDKYGNTITKDSIVEIEEDHILYASYDYPDHYTIHFDGNGNLNGQMDDIDCEYDKSYFLPDIGFDGGEGFLVWEYTVNGQKYYVDNKGEIINLVDRNTPSVTLRAIWTDNNTVIYHDGITGAVIGSPIDVGHTCLIKSEKHYPQLVIPNLKFLGWSKKKDGLVGGKEDYRGGAGGVISGKVDLYPVYETNTEGEFALIFYDNGGSGGPGTLTFARNVSSTILPTTTPTRDRYEFKKWKQGLLFYYPNTLFIWSRINTAAPFDPYNTKGVRYTILTADWKFEEQELILDYGYDGKTKKVTVKKSDYKLPAPPSRKGYVFLGWGENKYIVKYHEKDEFLVPEGGATLYAIWDYAPMEVSFYDPFSCREYDNKTMTVESVFPGELFHIQGLEFKGWTDKMFSSVFSSEPYWRGQISLSPKFFEGEPLSKLGYKSFVTLYPCYSYKNDRKNGITALYIVNDQSVTNVPPAGYANGENGCISVSGIVPKKAGCKFAGWNWMVENDPYRAGICRPGEQLSNIKKGETVLLYPTWESNIHLFIDLNYGGKQPVDIGSLYLPGTVVEGKDLYDIYSLNNEGHYLKGWGTKEGVVTVKLTDSYTIPTKDTTLYAVWGDYEYTIYYFNGFTGDMYCSETVGSKAKISFVPPKEAGYTFTGWKKAKEQYFRFEESILSWGDDLGPHPFENEPDYTIVYNSVTMTGNLYLYSCFVEKENTDDEKVMVCYNATGGTGGPEVDYYDPDEGPYKIRKEEPHKDGEVFMGWSTSVYADQIDYVAGDECKETVPEDRKIYFFAVWIPDTSNSIKKEMQKRFGPDVMPDYYFDCEYESAHWEKVNDHCYFAIKTWNFYNSSVLKAMRSTVFIVNYSNGEWKLETYGLKKSINESFKFEIITKNNDFVGHIKKTFAETAKTAISIFVPALGTFISGLDFLSSLQDVIYKYGSNDEKAMDALVASLTEKVVDLYIKDLKAAGKFDSDIKEFLDVNYNYIKKCCKTAVTVDFKFDIIDGLQRFADGLAMANTMAEKITEIELDKIESKVTEEVLRTTTEEMRKFDGADFYIVGNTAKSFGWGMINVAINEAIDIARNSKYSGTDPFGQYNVALGTYKEALADHFNDNIVRGFDSMLNDIFHDNYGM